MLQVIRPAGGGMLAHVKLLLEGLAGRGFKTAVACPGGGEAREVLARTGVGVYPLHLCGEMSPTRDLADIAKLVLILRTGSFGIVHAHGLKAALVALAAAKVAGRVSTVYTAHGATPVLDGSLVHLRRKAAGGLLRRYDCLIAVSKHTRQTLASTLCLDPALMQVIYNGIEFPNLGSPGGLTFQTGGPLVGTVARLAPCKGVDVFLRAAGLILREDPRVSFVVAGDGPLWPQLRKLSGELGLDGHVLFTGGLREAGSLMSLMDVFVLPSRQEGLPLALLEAMARARPVVASRTGGIPEVLDEGTGVLVPPGDATIMAAQVLCLLRDRDLAERLGRTAQKKVLLRFGAARMQQETVTLYRRLLAGDTPAGRTRFMEGVSGA